MSFPQFDSPDTRLALADFRGGCPDCGQLLADCRCADDAELLSLATAVPDDGFGDWDREWALALVAIRRTVLVGMLTEAREQALAALAVRGVATGPGGEALGKAASALLLALDHLK